LLMNELERLRITASELLDQLLALFTPRDCAALLRHMANEVEIGDEIARQIGRFRSVSEEDELEDTRGSIGDRRRDPSTH
jgi:hypothetical protein